MEVVRQDSRSSLMIQRIWVSVTVKWGNFLSPARSASSQGDRVCTIEPKKQAGEAGGPHRPLTFQTEGRIPPEGFRETGLTRSRKTVGGGDYCGDTSATS